MLTGRPVGRLKVHVERVLERRAGEQEPAAAAQGAQRLGGLRAAVLQVLRLVGQDEVELHRLEQDLIARERAVGSDDEVVRPEILPGQPAGAMVDEDPQVRREARRLAPPVFHQRGRADDERGVGWVILDPPPTA